MRTGRRPLPKRATIHRIFLFTIFLSFIFLPAAMATHIQLEENKEYTGKIIDDNRSEYYLELPDGTVVNIEKRDIVAIDGEPFEYVTTQDVMMDFFQATWIYWAILLGVLVIYIILPLKVKIVLLRAFPIVLVLLVAGVAAGVYFGSGPLLDKGSRQILETLGESLKKEGIELKSADYTEVKLRSLSTVGWTEFTAQVVSDQKVDLKVGNLTIRLEDFGERAFLMTAEDIQIEFEPMADLAGLWDLKTSNRLKGKEAWIRFKADFFKPKEAVQDLEKTLVSAFKLVSQGEADAVFEFAAESSFVVGRKVVRANLMAVEEDGKSILMMNQKDLQHISDQLEEKLTDAEIEIMSRQPLRVPDLLRISDHALGISKRANQKNPSVPEDAYRHVLWSYLLTEVYGEAFTKQITDAHEEDVSGQSERERAMDLNNNEVGRRYAAEGAVESDILNRVMRDSDVIRSAAPPRPQPLDLSGIVEAAGPLTEEATDLAEASEMEETAEEESELSTPLGEFPSEDSALRNLAEDAGADPSSKPLGQAPTKA